MYPESMSNLIKIVEKTRKERIAQAMLPPLSIDEKKTLLSKFHPDYKIEKMRQLQVGPNKGDKTPHEIADIVEAYSLINPAKYKVGSPAYETDVLVIGAGGAGVAAALVASEAGAKVLLATKLRLGDANTAMAQGGIQAADRLEDSPVTHYLDVVGGGGFTNIPELVRALVMDGPSVIAWLEDLGMMFDKDAHGNMIEIHGGGTSIKRMHSARDYTGGEIMKTLRDEFLNRRIPYLEFSPAVELFTHKQRCTGALLYNLETSELIPVRAKCTILATGGSGRLHIQGFPTTNHYGATADGLVIAYRAGVPFLFMDTIQYHPTGAAFPEQILGQLVTEKVRGLGAHLVNVEGARFVRELETRDAVSAAIIRECEERKKGVTLPSGLSAVWLDSPVIDIIHGEGTVKKQLPAMWRQYIRFNIDMAKEPILTYPTQHYQNGGLKIDEFGRTPLKGLYAAGEVSGGIHGRNRLMGNSLLDILVFGRRAGRKAAEEAKTTDFGELTLTHITNYHKELRDAGIKPERFSPMILPDYRPEHLRHKTAPIIP
ncbi:MAG: FAD-binding protein [Planctomycetota bacterium]|nr:FAD-binding protein [Planctomycetota bacterium]